MSDASSKPSAGAGRALVPFAAAAAGGGIFFTWRRAGLAASLLAVFAVGAAGTHAAQLAWSRLEHRTSLAQADATAQTLRRLQDEVARLKGSVDTLRTAADTARQDDGMRTLRRSVEALKADLQQARAADGASMQQIAAKLDRPGSDTAARLADIVARLDRIEHPPQAQKGAAAVEAPPSRPADPASRPERAERQAAERPSAERQGTDPAATGSIPPVAAKSSPEVTTVARTATPPMPPVPPRRAEAAPAGPGSTVLAAWVLRDVYDGVALVEGRRGDMREVGPGEYLPGAGQIRSIQRHGRAWVVTTSQGVIGTDTF